MNVVPKFRVNPESCKICLRKDTCLDRETDSKSQNSIFIAREDGSCIRFFFDINSRKEAL